MKIKLFLTSSALIVVSIVVYGGYGLCQQPPPIFGSPNASVINTKGHPTIGSGTFLGLIVTSANIWPAMNGLKRITVVNTDTGIDDNTYELPLTPNTYNLVCEWNSEEEFTGQHGTYEFTIEKFSGAIELSYTQELPDGLTPLPIPENLEVSFESGLTTPTLSFDPVSDVDFDVYELRVYDKNYTRRIYRALIPEGQDPITIFGDPNSRFGGQTWEDLVPGERYIFRADIYKYYQGTTVPMLMGMNFRSFKVPKKEHKKYK